MTYFDQYNVQHPLENCCVHQSVGPTIFQIPPNKRGRGITLPRALSPRKPRSPYIINMPINRPVTPLSHYLIVLAKPKSGTLLFFIAGTYSF